MAIYHFHGKAVCRSKGHSAVAAAAYRAGEKLLDERRDCIHHYRPRRHGMMPATGAAPEGSAVAAAAYRAGDRLMDERHRRAHDYRPRSGVAASFILTPPQASAWMADRQMLWNACEAIERRKDSCVARELEVALPRELSLDAHIALATGFVLEQLVSRGVVADVAIHQGPARDGGANPHAHILLYHPPRPQGRQRLRQKRPGPGAAAKPWRNGGSPGRITSTAPWPTPTLNRRLLAMEQRGLDTEHGERWRAESHATGLLTAEPLTDMAACLAAAARMTPPQSRTHDLLALASQALGRKG